jgi:hypothetical protein
MKTIAITIDEDMLQRVDRLAGKNRAVGPDDRLPRQSGIRCDFLTLMSKTRLTGFVSMLPAAKQRELKRALAHALQLDR